MNSIHDTFELAPLTGTEKQIAYANDLRRSFLPTILTGELLTRRQMIVQFGGTLQRIFKDQASLPVAAQGDARAFAEVCTSMINLIPNITSAKWWIENGKSGDTEKILRAAILLATDPAARAEAGAI